MNTNDTSYRRTFAILVVATCLAATGAISSATASPSARSATDVRSAPSCASSPQSSAACRVVDRFFEHASNRRYAASCALLGARLLYESGGASCASAMSWAYFAGAHNWKLMAARPTELSVGVLVRLGLPELGRIRSRTWLATIASEQGAPKIVSTRLVD